jgi:hypothetical protein
VESGLYNYQGFVNLVLEKCREQATDPYFGRKQTSSGLSLIQNRFQDWLSWKKDYYWHRIYERLPSKWLFLTPAIKLIKFVGIKKPIMKIYFKVTGKKSFP